MNIGTVFRRKLCMQVRYSPKSLSILLIIILWFFVQTVSILPDQNMSIPSEQNVLTLLSAICVMGKLRYFGIEYYAWSLGIIQNVCKYCPFCFSDILSSSCVDTIKSVLESYFILDFALHYATLLNHTSTPLRK